MTVAFDARMVAHSGIGTHIRGLLRATRSLSHPPEMSLLGDLNQLTRLHFHHGFQLERYVSPIYSAVGQFMFPSRWKGARALHVPHYNIPYRFADPLVVTVHDLIHLLFPEQVGSSLKQAYARYTFKKVANTADRIVCVSEHTRRDVLERLDVEEDRVTVLPNAVDDQFIPTDDESEVVAFRRRRGLPREYLLAVGIDKPHKNYAFLLRALAPLWEGRDKAPPLVIAGAGSSREQLPTTIGELGVSERVILPERLPDEEMPLLYQAATALVYPSTYEGFGLPMLEAQRVGTPVASSNASSLPEVGGLGAVFFDPTDEEECRDTITRLLEDSELRSDIVASGHKNEQRYSWAKGAEILGQVYRRL